jgi:hypothetical protein
LTAYAGTDCFLNRVKAWNVPGGDRVYVKVDGPLTYAAWIDALRAGRSFVSNGPVVELTVDGKGLGETWNYGPWATSRSRQRLPRSIR